MNYLFTPLVVSILLSIGLGIPAIMLAQRLKLLDIPGSAPHKKHSRSMPLAGGILLVSAFGITMILFRQWVNHEILAVFFGAVIVFAFGIYDDRNGLSAGPKLVGQLLATIILISSGVQVYFISIFSNSGFIPEFVAQVLNVLITLFWLIGITNALNMIDSMDGIVAGLGIIASALFLGATHLADQSTYSFWLATLLGINAGLYYWNKTAAKFFLGDSGSQTIGFLLASFGILYNPLNRSPESSWMVPIMLLGIPIFDTTLVVISRIKRNQAIGTGRRDHTYHRLIALGLSPKNAVLITHICAMIISFLAFLTLYLPPIIALIFFFSTLLCGLILLIWLERQPTPDDLHL